MMRTTKTVEARRRKPWMRVVKLTTKVTKKLMMTKMSRCLGTKTEDNKGNHNDKENVRPRQKKTMQVSFGIGH